MGFELSNLAALLFFAINLAFVIFRPAASDDSLHFIYLMGQIMFLHGTHSIFQFWSLETSPDFRRASGRPLERIGLGVTEQVFLVLLFWAATFFVLRGSPEGSAKLFLAVFSVWGTWHTLSQTRGLYIAQRIASGHGPGAKLMDITAMRIFVNLIFAARCSSVAQRFFSLPPAHSHALKMGFLFLCLISYLAALGLALRTDERSRLAPLMRLSLWFFTFGSPLAAYGIIAVHGSEYFDIQRRIGLKSERKEPSAAFLVFFAALFLSLVVYEGLGTFHLLEESALAMVLLSSLGFAVTAVHYVFDTFAFKMRDPAARETVLSFLT